jgi:voltage-gated potassium channel
MSNKPTTPSQVEYRWQRRRQALALRGLLYPLCLSMLILGVGGLGFWMLDPKVHTFSEGLWLAFTTAATVGYGDLVPSTHASRVFSVFVVLTGLAVLSLVTAAVAAMFIESDEKLLEMDLLQELQQLRQEVRELREEIRQGRA